MNIKALAKRYVDELLKLGQAEAAKKHDEPTPPDHLTEWNDLFTNYNSVYIRDVLSTVYVCESKYRFPRRRRERTSEDQPYQSEPFEFHGHKCPACGNHNIVIMIEGEETVWKCATEGCVVPARQFITTRGQQ